LHNQIYIEIVTIHVQLFIVCNNEAKESVMIKAMDNIGMKVELINQLYKFNMKTLPKIIEILIKLVINWAKEMK
jgi:hypothetical protein